MASKYYSAEKRQLINAQRNAVHFQDLISSPSVLPAPCPCGLPLLPGRHPSLPRAISTRHAIVPASPPASPDSHSSSHLPSYTQLGVPTCAEPTTARTPPCRHRSCRSIEATLPSRKPWALRRGSP